MGASSLFRSSVSIVRPLRTVVGGEVVYNYDATVQTEATSTFWAGSASSALNVWADPENATGAPDGASSTQTGLSIGTLLATGYDFSALPSDAAISAFSVVSHVEHDFASAKDWTVFRILNSAQAALGMVEYVDTSVAAATTVASETLHTHEDWTSEVTTKAELSAAVDTVQVTGDGDAEDEVTWSCDAVGVRVTYTYATSAATTTTGVRCEIQAKSGREAVEFDRVTGRTVYTGWFARDVSIQLADRVLWTPRGGSAKTLEVKSNPRDPTGIGDHVEVDLEEVL